MKVDFNKFITGENNVCLITGLSGSGKTTLAKQLALKYNAVVVSLDRFVGNFDDSTDPVLDSYSPDKEIIYDDNALAYEVEQYLNFAISYCNNDKSTKYIIEGVQIFWLMNGSDLKGCSLICMDTSPIKCAFRRVKRVTYLNRKKYKTSLKTKLYDILSCIKIDREDIRGYNAFKKEIIIGGDAYETS